LAPERNTSNGFFSDDQEVFHVKHFDLIKQYIGFKMKLPLDKYFNKYEGLVKLVDEAFDRVKSEYGECVKCASGCSDCCFAIFDLTLIEAMYVNYHFNQKYTGGTIRHDMIERANRADRKLHKLKKKAHAETVEGRDELSIIGDMSMERVRCPLLSMEDKCDLYEFRPIACRVYGIPTSAMGVSHTCGKTSFEQGKKYPALNMDMVYKKLYEFSADFIAELPTTYTRMSDMLVPVSMAILTEYNDEYLGIINDDETGDK